MIFPRLLHWHVHLRQSASCARPSSFIFRNAGYCVYRGLSTSISPNEIKLRDYQEDCIKSVLKHVQDGQKRLGISLATGSGKTIIFTHLIERVQPHDEKATQTLILAHRRELVEQAARHCTNTYPNKTIEIELGKSHASGAADITIASMQSITSGDRLQKFDPTRFKLILVDEAHHIVAPKYLEILEHFRLRPHLEDSPVLVGVSATFARFDGIQLGAAIDHIVFHRDYLHMINRGWLSDVLFTTVRLKNADLSKVAVGKNGDFVSTSLSAEVNTELNNDAVVDAWFERCSERKSTLVFCVDVRHVLELAATFKRRGIDSKAVTGSTRNQIRSATIDAFKQGDFPVLLNCGVFTEGTDIPNIDCVLLARPTKSRNLLVQMIGRGMRLSPGKENCHVIDMVTSLKTGIVTTPTLYGLDPDEIVQDAQPGDLQDMRDRKEKERATQEYIEQANVSHGQPGPSTTMHYTDYDSITDLIEDTAGERQIRALSHYSWVQVGEDDYVLASSTFGFIRIQRNEKDNWIVRSTAKLPYGTAAKSPYARARVIVNNALTFEAAVHGADTFVKGNITPLVLIEKQAPWRSKEASDGQVDYLNKFRSDDSLLSPETLSKGRATDMITKIKFGARGTFKKITAAKKRVERGLEKGRKADEMRLREVVKEGPLLANY